MNFLAADIGATNSRLAWVVPEGIRTTVYRNADFSDLYQVIEQFLREQGATEDRITRMVLALPGPLDRDCMRLTNIDWVVERSRLFSRFRVDEVRLLNDFQAAAVGALYSEALSPLNPPPPGPRAGGAVVTGAGTGLGLAWCADVADCSLPVATEGGHADLAPVNEEQYGLHAWLAQRYGHVSWERVLSGEGLRDMYRYFSGGREEAPTAAEISLMAQDGGQEATRVVRCFATFLGQYAGNLALQFNPRAGIYLCGGVTGHLASWIEQAFVSSYLDKGRMRGLVEQIPAYLVTEELLGLMGAIRIAKGVTSGET